MTRRYACARMLFNGLKLESAEAVEPEGPGAPAARSLPAPARMEQKHYLGAGQTASGRLLGPHQFPRSPNVLRLSGDGGEADGVRCSRGFGGRLLVSRNMTRRYARARMLFNGLKPELAEAIEPEGPGAPAVRSPPAPARMERKHYLGAGQTASGRQPGPRSFPRSPNV